MKCQSLFSGRNKKKYFKMSSDDFFYPACRELVRSTRNRITVISVLCFRFPSHSNRIYVVRKCL